MPAYRLLLPLLACLLLLIGCQPADEPSASASATPPASEQIDPPAAPGSGQPQLHVDAEDTLWMSWIEPTGAEDEHALRYAALDGEAWSEPQTAAAGTDWFVNWADVPSVRTLPDGRMAAHYLVSSGPNVYAYDVHITQAAGDDWQQAITPHQDGTETEHGFVSMLPWEGEDLLAVWLDGREMSQDNGEGGHDGEGAMTLRSAILNPSGELQRQDLLDERVCECCPTSAVRTDEGALVAYRNRSEEEIRNIGLVRFDGETWSAPYLLHDDGWEIPGCPVNGPSLAAEGNRVVAAWFTAPGNAPSVRAAFSDDGGRSFDEPVIIDETQPSGQVQAVLLDDGAALVSWYGQDGDRSALRVRRVAPDGTLGPATSVVAPMPSVRTGIPRMARSGDTVYFAWADAGENADETRVHLLRAPVERFR